MAIHTAAYLKKSLQTPLSELPFQVGDFQIKAIREFAKKLMQQFSSQTWMHYPPTPALFKKQSSKLTRIKYHKVPTTRVDTDEKLNKDNKHPPFPPRQICHQWQQDQNAPKN